METLLISACRMGYSCTYNGGNNALPQDVLAALRQRYRLIPVCPEAAGGLPTPRTPSERRGDRVINRDGRDVTAAFRRGAELAGELAERFDAHAALLKANSPSCGSGTVYDGSFSGRLVSGDGVTAEYLKSKNLIIFKNPSTLLT